MTNAKQQARSADNSKDDNYPSQLLEIESLLSEILADITHPLNNPKHRDHALSQTVYAQLQVQAETLRQNWLMKPESKKRN